MRDVVSPEELAALLQGLRDTAGGAGPGSGDPPEAMASREPIFPEREPLAGLHNFSTWLMALADLRWPHL
jgi:hypothetical protein